MKELKLVAVGKKGDYGFVAFPATIEVERVVDGTDHVVTAKDAKGKDGSDYKVYRVALDFNFKVTVEGTTYLYKMNNAGTISFNGTK